MEFRVLGPIEAWHGGQRLDLGSRKQRALLAILLLRANEVVSADALIDGVWGERAPPTAAHTLQVYVSRLRGVLRRGGAGDDVLATRPPGYVLRVPPADLDLARFERLAEDGRRALAAGSPARAADKLRDALALWTGPPLSDLPYEPFAQLEIERLEEHRLAALEDRAEAELALGGHAALVPELEALVARHPLREHLRAQLMLALYRSGHQADALATYRDARDHLVGELGLEPGKELRALEQAVLEQDPALEPPRIDARVGLEPPRTTPATAPRRRGRRALAGALAVIGLAAGTALVIVAGGDRASDRERSRVSRLDAIDVRSGNTLVAADLPGSPADVALGMGSVWVAEPDGGRIARIDPRSGRVTDQIRAADQPGHVAVGGGAVWVASALSDRISRIDPVSGDNTRRPPFDDVRVRRALNCAIDRGRVAAWNGGGLVARPHCQPLAPGLPGFRRYCPYTRGRRADGRWHGPDVTRARALVAASGTRGERVDVWAASITPAMRRDAQLTVDGNWAPDYPSPSAYLPQFFGCRGGNGNGYFCDPALDRQMARASALQIGDPARAASLWAAIDGRLVDQAAWVPTVSWRSVEFVSERVRQYEYSPVGGFIAHEAWLR